MTGCSFLLLKALGDTFKRQHDPLRAMRYYQGGLNCVNEFLEIEPHNPRWLKYRSLFLTDIGDILEAEDHLQAALEHYLYALEAAQKALVLSEQQHLSFAGIVESPM